MKVLSPATAVHATPRGHELLLEITDRRPELVHRCGHCRQVVLEAHQRPGRGPLVAGYVYLVDARADWFVYEDTGEPYEGEEGRLRDKEPAAVTVVQLGEISQHDVYVACSCGHLRALKADLDVVLADLRTEKGSRNLFQS